MNSVTRRSKILSRVLFLLPFLSLYFLQLAHHQMWRDEFNPWGIACVSRSLAELLLRVHYEAHPALWYVLLYGASHISHEAWMLKVVQGTIGTGIFLLLGLTTPFRRLELALIFLSYYISFEYTVLCRMYGLEVLIALVYVWFRMRRPQWMVRNILWLGLMANVDATSGILATGLLFEYMLERYRHQKATGEPKLEWFAAAVATYGCCVAFSIATLWPAKDIGWSSTGKLFSLAGDPAHIGSALALWFGMCWFPQTMQVQSLWSDPNVWPHAFIVPLMLVLYFLVFRKHRDMALMLVVVSVTGMAFSVVTNVGAIRHVGVCYLAFVLALYMMRSRGEMVSPISYVMLALAVAGTVYNIAGEWGKPYTDDDATALWIVANHLQNVPMIGLPDTNTIGVPERLARPVYQLECQCADRVMTFSHKRDGFKYQTQVSPGIVQGMQRLGVTEALLLDNELLPEKDSSAMKNAGVTATFLAKFDRGYLPDEHFFVYRLTEAQTLPAERRLY